MTSAAHDSHDRQPAQPINWKALLTGLAFSVMIFCFGYTLLYFGILAPQRAVRESQDWVETPCEILSSSLAIHDDNFENRNGDAKTYSIEVEYKYWFQEHEYVGARYDFSELSDGYLESKKEVVDSLPPGTETVCFVNPENPAEAVLRRGYGPEASDWKPSLFTWVVSIGLILLGLLIAAGTLLLCFMDRLSRAIDRRIDRLVEEPGPDNVAESD